MNHENKHEEDAESPMRAVAKEMAGAIVFVAAALGIAWLEQLFPGGKAPAMVKAFVVISDLILIMGAAVAFTRALRIFVNSARDVTTPLAKETSAPDSSDGRGQPAGSDEHEPQHLTGTSEVAPDSGYWAVTLCGPDGQRYRPRVVRASIDNPDSFRSHLVGIARLEAPSETDAGEQWIGKYELEVRKVGMEESSPSLMTLRWDGSPMPAELPAQGESAENDDMAKVVDLRSSRRMH